MNHSERIDSIFARMNSLAADFANAGMTATDFRDLFDEILDNVSDVVRDMQSEIEMADKAVRDAAGIIDLAIAHHDDAERFGWMDRDQEAWRLIVDAACELEDALPVSA